jgi:hypothetical protein
MGCVYKWAYIVLRFGEYIHQVFEDGYSIKKDSKHRRDDVEKVVFVSFHDCSFVLVTGDPRRSTK